MVRAEVDGSILLKVPAGPFVAGGPEPFEGGVEPFEASLESFYLALHPVTQAQYARFVAATGHPPPRGYSGGRPLEELWAAGAPREDALDHPVVGVRWSDAVAYCRWAGLRLPSELEWEKAARGPCGLLYPWGTGWEPSRCRSDADRARGTTASVFGHGAGAGPYGHYDLCGNVWEWCEDAFDPGAYRRYRRGALEAPREGRQRVARGGSWFNVSPESLRATCRHACPADDASGCYGFRAAWSG